MPFCAGMGRGRQFYSFDAQAGRSAVLVLGNTSCMAALHGVVGMLAARLPAFAALQVDVLVLLGFAAGPGVWSDGPGADCGIQAVLCHPEFFAACGAIDEAPLILVVDRAARVVARCAVAATDPGAAVARAAEAAGGIGREVARCSVLPAPLLRIPGLLDAALCRDLIERFEAGANFDSGVSGTGADGRPRDALDHGRKRRRDWLLQPEDPMHGRIAGLLLRRAAPELRRAFQHQASHLDRVLVARYDENDGYFRRHRDNVGKDVSFRQFALSVNLNTEAYEGGHLSFPEYNDHRYRPATGEGIVFSASLLHEAAPVTKGRRYVLLTFLHDAGAEARRCASRN